jgi:hypothetical protein
VSRVADDDAAALELHAADDRRDEHHLLVVATELAVHAARDASSMAPLCTVARNSVFVTAM